MLSSPVLAGSIAWRRTCHRTGSGLGSPALTASTNPFTRPLMETKTVRMLLSTLGVNGNWSRGQGRCWTEVTEVTASRELRLVWEFTMFFIGFRVLWHGFLSHLQGKLAVAWPRLAAAPGHPRKVLMSQQDSLQSEAWATVPRTYAGAHAPYAYPEPLGPWVADPSVPVHLGRLASYA